MITKSRLRQIRFKHSKARLMYWAYAFLNKKFSQEVKFTRDSLHRVYEVNRYGFEVATNTLSVEEVFAWAKQHLKNCGFTEKKDGSLQIFEKKNEHGDNWGFVLQLQKDVHARKSVYVSPFFYEKHIY